MEGHRIIPGTKRSTSMDLDSCGPVSMSPVRRRTVSRESEPSARSEELMTKIPTSRLSVVSPRSAPFPAYCVSLVTTSQVQASDVLPSPSPSLSPDGFLLSPRGCPRQQLLVSQDLMCPPAPTHRGYTGSATQAPSVLLDRLSSEAAISDCATEGVGASLGETSANSPAGACAQPALASSTMCSRVTGLLPDILSVRSLLNTAWPRLTLESMQIVPVPATMRLQRLYELRVSLASRDTANGMHDMLVLVLGPPSMLRLLRSEQWIIKSEAVIIKWIRGVLLSDGSARMSNAQHEHGEGYLSGGSVWDQPRSHDEKTTKDVDLLRLLPALIDHSQSSKELGSAYNVLSHLDGTSFSSLPSCLSISERRYVDLQAGRLIRRLSHLKSPSGKFGPAISVLCPTDVVQSRAGGSMENPGGMDSWALAFHAILEGILRDAEDMAVTIPYEAIRRQFRRLRYFLERVIVPRLVILDAAHESNIMAQRTAPGHDARMKTNTVLEDPFEDSDESDISQGGGRRQGCEHAPSIRLTGLREWSNCIFGDPLMAMVFSDKPSREFLHGFNGQSKKNKDHVDEGDGRSGSGGFHSWPMYGDIVEIPEEAHVRLLLYQCYHATVAIVKEFYRPRCDSTSREFAARKRLNRALMRLEEVEWDPKREHERPSGETSSPKKPKIDESEEGADI